MPAYKLLADLGFEVFTPMRCKIYELRGQKVRREVPYIPDLLFVHTTREKLDPIIDATPTLLYRFVKGGEYCEVMVVREAEMRSFMNVATADAAPKYYSLDEITELMIGKPIRIVGGPLNGTEGKLLSVRGSKKRRIFVNIPNLMGVSTEVSPEFIEFIKEQDDINTQH